MADEITQLLAAQTQARIDHLRLGTLGFNGAVTLGHVPFGHALGGERGQQFFEPLTLALELEVQAGNRPDARNDAGHATVAAQHRLPGLGRLAEVLLDLWRFFKRAADVIQHRLILRQDAGFEAVAVVAHTGEIFVRLAHQVGVVERHAIGPVIEPVMTTKALGHRRLDHPAPTVGTQPRCHLDHGVDAQVEHGHGPDQTAAAGGAFLGGRALGVFNPAGQDRADFVDFDAFVRVGAQHQGVHFLVVGVALEQVRDFAAQDQLRHRVVAFSQSRVTDLGKIGERHAPAIAGEVEQVDLIHNRVFGGFNQPEGHLRGQRRQVRHQHAARCLQLPVEQWAHVDRVVFGGAEAGQNIHAHDAVALHFTALVIQAEQRVQRCEHGGRQPQLVQAAGQRGVDVFQSRLIAPQQRKQLRALCHREARRELEHARPIGVVKQADSVGKTGFEVVPQRDHIVGADAR